MIWSTIGGFIGTLAAKLLAFFAIYRSGEKAQSQRDQAVTLEAVERERDALADAPRTKADAMKRLTDGTA